MMLCICLFANAQATDLVIDCQTPGWLSSMIKYGDQQTVRNLKVTGYINETDLKFIGSLIQNQALNEVLDLSDVNIIGDYFKGSYWGISESSYLRTLHLPHTLKEVEYCFPGEDRVSYLEIDTLFFNCNQKYIEAKTFVGGQFVQNLPRNIIVSDKTDSIPDWAFLEKGGIEYVQLSSRTKYIGNNAFPIAKCRVNSMDLKDLEYLGIQAFFFSPDTITVPEKIEEYNLFSFGHTDGQHIFIGENVKTVNGSKLEGGAKPVNSYTTAKIIFHMSNTTPPVLVNYKGLNEDTNLSSSTIYVPKGTREAYKKANYWGNATIIELNPIESMTLIENSIKLKKEEQAKLSVSISPVDADDQTVIWTSSDESVAIVDAYGNVTALKAGEAWIEAASKANPEIKDKCKVTVLQPATGISLNMPKCTLTEIGESTELEATVSPEDASNKNVKWKSTDENVCIVANGTVVAVGNGVCVIIATSEDGGYMATCKVTVNIFDSVKCVNGAKAVTIESISDAAGRRINTLQRGINILRMSDGTTKKVLIK
jgi:uncharacterized protein YjdB